MGIPSNGRIPDSATATLHLGRIPASSYVGSWTERAELGSYIGWNGNGLKIIQGTMDGGQQWRNHHDGI